MSGFTKRPLILRIIVLLAFVLAGGLPAGAQTLKAVKERGMLNCGVSQGLLGFSSMDDENAWTGFDVDICRAVAAAIFGDPAKVTFVPLDAAARFAALQSNQIDAGVVSPPTNSEAKKLGFKELINLAVDGPAYASVTIAVKNSFLAGNRDTVTRFIRAYARGVHRFKTDKKYGMQATNKYLKLDDQGVLEDTWNQFSKYLAEPPYIQGFEAVIDDAAIQDAKLKGATPGQFMDMSVVKQLDDSGYFKRL